MSVLHVLCLVAGLLAGILATYSFHAWSLAKFRRVCRASNPLDRYALVRLLVDKVLQVDLFDVAATARRAVEGDADARRGER